MENYACPENSIQGLSFDSESERARSFAFALDELVKETEREMGPHDVDHVRNLKAISNLLEITGRGLILFSFEPFSFGVGVFTLAAHKSLELMEIGHTVLHGAYDKLTSKHDFQSKTFRWKAPIDEESWRRAHNILHHRYTNIAGKDPDLDFGFLRLSARIPHRVFHRLQPWSNLATWSIFGLAIGLHVSGMIAVYWPSSTTERDNPRTPTRLIEAHSRFLRKTIPYYAREFLFYPVLAGPFFGKVWFGNLLSEWIRDLYAASIIYCGHVGAEDSDIDTRFHSRAEYYVEQVRRAQNLRVHPLLSVLAGGLDHQVEHHLFPHLPPHRLRALAPRVKRACAAHDIPYRSDTFPRRITQVWRTLAALRSNKNMPAQKIQ